MEPKLLAVILFLSLLCVHFLIKEEHTIEKHKAEQKENKESLPQKFLRLM